MNSGDWPRSSPELRTDNIYQNASLVYAIQLRMSLWLRMHIGFANCRSDIQISVQNAFELWVASTWHITLLFLWSIFLLGDAAFRGGAGEGSGEM